MDTGLAGSSYIEKKVKKTVCFFSGDITRCGGAERVSTIIANGLARAGKYRVIFLSIIEQNSPPFFTVASEIKRYVLKKEGKWLRPGLQYLPLVPALRKFLKKQSVDIIIDIDLVLDVLSIPAAAQMPVKVVSWEHFHYYYEQKVFYRKMISRLSARFSDYMITLTRQDKENYEKNLHRHDRMEFIYNPIEISENTKNPNSNHTHSKECMLITVGSLSEGKGTDIAAQIAPAILIRHKNWKWYFLGDGEYKEVLKEVAVQYQLEERLILKGNVSDVENYLKRASIFVMTSRSEGMPMCLLEAKASRLPCIAFQVPTGPSEIIQDGVNGFLVQPFDLEAMIGKIEILIENECLRNRFSENTVVGIEKFQMSSILKRWEHVFEKV